VGSTAKYDLARRSMSDGMVNVADLLIRLRVVHGLDEPASAEIFAGDLTGDSLLDFRDVLVLPNAVGM